jgi:hypothetical protein
LESSQLKYRRLAIQIIPYHKASYKLEDIDMLNSLASAVELNVNPISKIYEVKKMIGTKMVWKCGCTRENEANIELCQCGLDICGFRQSKISDTLKLINERVKALESVFNQR